MKKLNWIVAVKSLIVLGGAFLSFDLTTTSAQETAAGQRATGQLAGVTQDDGPSPTSIRQLIGAGNLDQALADLEKVTAESPDAAWLFASRTALASAMQRQGRADEALQLLMLNFNKTVENPKIPNAIPQLPLFVSQLNALLRAKGEPAEAEKVIAKAIEILQVEQQAAGSANPNSELLMRLFEQVASTTERQVNEERFLGELERVEKLYNSNPNDALAIGAYLNALTANAFPSYDRGRPQQEYIDKLLEVAPAAVQNNLESPQILNSYINATSRVASSLMRDNPQHAGELLAQAKLLVTSAKEKQPNPTIADRGLQSIASLESRIASAIKQLEMVGKPAPALDAMAWVNGDLSGDALQGKVILLDFWAVWCGPCIATFPHLREWHEQYHSQGLEIVGVTRQYNYAWNDETNRAAKLEETVSLEDELAMLEKFIAHHKLHHATMVTPAGSSMQSEYGVTGIPHAVLIDKQGRVRMIKVGSGDENARALHDMIKTLLAE